MAKKTKLEVLREAERLLTDELARLRKRIHAAERGQNKRIKDSLKYIKSQNKAIERTLKVQSKLQEQELERLEKFLGESFESLEEARESFTKGTRKATKRELLAYRTIEAKKARESAARAKTDKQRARKIHEAERLERQIAGRKLDPKKPSYKIRQLSDLENQQVLDFLSDKVTFNNVGLDYLQPNERITVSVPFRYHSNDGRIRIGRGIGRKAFRSWAELQTYINAKYVEETSNEDWLGDIEVIKFSDDYQYQVEKGRATDQKNTRRKDARERGRKERKETKRKIREQERKRFEKKNAKLIAENKRLKGRN